MDKDNIDASAGLTFSLKLFYHYRKSGLLQASIRHVPGISGQCKAYLQLVNGTVVACFVDDRRGQRHQISPDVLGRVDDERGPFEWSFQPQPVPSSAVPAEQSASFEQTTMPIQPTTGAQSSSMPPQMEPFLPSMQDVGVPTVVAPLEWARLSHWTLQERQLLYTVLNAIDGKQTVQAIKASLPLAPQIIDESLHILQTLNVVIISS